MNKSTTTPVLHNTQENQRALNQSGVEFEVVSDSTLRVKAETPRGFYIRASHLLREMSHNSNPGQQS